MIVCGSTKGLLEQSWRETCSDLAEMGFRHAQVDVDSKDYGHFQEAVGNPELVEEKRTIAENLGLSIEVVSIESSLCNPQKELDEKIESIRPYVDMVAGLGGDLLCISRPHTSSRPRRNCEYMYYLIGEGLQRLENYAKRKNVKLALENNPELPATVEECNAALLGTDPEQTGICLDPVSFKRIHVDPVEAVRTLGDRIFSVSFRDFRPSAGEEAELCELGAGCINHFALIKALCDIDYNGPASIEYECSDDFERGMQTGFEYISRLAKL